MSKPIETYTFSRALHMMRYGSKKMRPYGYQWTYFVLGISRLMVDVGLDFSPYECKDDYALTSNEIMGEWVEVK